MSTWNSSPIHIVFYKNTPMEIIEKIVDVHCKDHHGIVKTMCMSFVDMCLKNEDCKFATAKGDGHDIRVDMID